MHKNLLFKALAIVVCCGILLVAIPGKAIAKKTPKQDVKMLTKSVQMLISILPCIDPNFEPGKFISKVNKKPYQIPKVGEGLNSKKNGGGD